MFESLQRYTSNLVSLHRALGIVGVTLALRVLQFIVSTLSFFSH
jgi:hypothetical protein